MIRQLFRILKWTFIVSLLIFLIHSWLMSKQYLFSDAVISSVTKKHIGKGNDVEKSFQLIHKELLEKYPGHILPESETEWLFIGAGGWKGSMKLLHASMTEYVLCFGTAVDTVGFSGRYWANISDTVISGEFRHWPEGKLTSKVYKSGDTVFHSWGAVTMVQWKTGTWMVEYGRGFVPSTLGFALSDTIFSAQDFLSIFYIVKLYLKALYMELVTFVLSLGV